VFIGGHSEGIVSTGPNARNVIYSTEGEFAYKITGLPQQATKLSREPWGEQPSQLLLAQHQVVSFTGRDGELQELRDWLGDPVGPENALRLLHGPGGQGKTRLALKLGATASPDWRVWQATSRTAQSPTKTGGATARTLGERALVIVDYAERWPADALVALVNDLAVRPAERRRMLLVARSAGSWWGSLLHDLRINGFHANATLLNPLAGGDTSERRQAYLAARDSFAKALELANPEAVKIPSDLDLDDDRFGLMLTVHMAALVAVYAHVGNLDRSHDENAAPEPSGDPETFSAVLLDRERNYWTKLHAAQAEDGIDADTMAQAVYTATLTGHLPYSSGQSALKQIGVESNKPPGLILKAHARAYPSGADGTYLEPLYPDRLGEDFLALTTPGHQRSYMSSDPWTDKAIDRLLAASENSGGPAWTRHALTILIETAARWPHIANSQLYPFLRRHPQRILEAGGTAIAALANLENVDFTVLEAIEGCMPGRHTSLNVGMAALSQRLGTHQLDQTNDPAKRAQINQRISQRCYNAGLHQQGVKAAKEAVRLYRDLAAEDSANYKEALADALDSFGIHLELTRQTSEALAATQEAADMYRELISADRTDLEPTLGRVLANLAGRRQLDPQSRLTIAREAVAIGRRCSANNPVPEGLELAGAIENLAVALENVGHKAEAVVATREAVSIRREQAAKAPEIYSPDLLRVLINLSRRLNATNKSAEALRVIEEVIGLYRRLAAADPAAHEAGLARSLDDLGWIAAGAGQNDRAIAVSTEAIELYRRLAAADPAYEPGLARSLHSLGRIAAGAGQNDRAIAVSTEAIELYRRLAAADPAAHEADLARSLYEIGVFRVRATGQLTQAFAAFAEAIELYRRLAAVGPAYEPGLALSLHSLGWVAAGAGQNDRAIAAFAEAIELYRRLAAADPAYERGLARGLYNIGKATSAVGRRTFALEAATESAAIYGRIKGSDQIEKELAAVADFLRSIQ
jgi:hypothetical protein